MTQSVNEITWPWTKQPAKVDDQMDDPDLNKVGSLLITMRKHTNPLVRVYAQKVIANFPTFSKGLSGSQLLGIITNSQQKLIQLSQNIPVEQLVNLAAAASLLDPVSIDQALQSLDKPPTAPTAPIAPKPQPSGTVPVGARISTAKGSFLRTTQGWVNAETNQPAQGALPIYLTKKYQAVMTKRGLTESSKPYHIRIRSVTK